MISGSSKIVIDYLYPIELVPIGEEKEMRRQIAFNRQKNLHYPPDTEKVISMPDFFKGTMISGKFKIDDKFLIARSDPDETPKKD